MGCSVTIVRNMKYCAGILENLMFVVFSERNSTFVGIFGGIPEVFRHPTWFMFAVWCCKPSLPGVTLCSENSGCCACNAAAPLDLQNSRAVKVKVFKGIIACHGIVFVNTCYGQMSWFNFITDQVWYRGNR